MQTVSQALIWQRIGRVTMSLIMIALIVFSARADSIAHPTQTSDWTKGYTLILLKGGEKNAANLARDAIVVAGGHIAIIAPPRVLLGWVPPEIADKVVGNYGIEAISYEVLDTATLTSTNEQELSAIEFYNRVVSGWFARDRELAASQKIEPLVNDAFEAPKPDQEALVEALRPMGIEPSAVGTADSMTGTVAAGIFFIESNGTIDQNTYTWLPSHVQDTITRSYAGLSWWSNKAAAYNRNLSFVLYSYGPTHSFSQTGYEPVLRSSSEDYLWIGQIMSNAGFSTGDYKTRVVAFNNWLRNSAGTNWGFSIFVAYNPSPALGTFTNGYSAYAWYGHYTQMLFRNSSSESAFGQVLSHETGHIFWACDEYYIPNYGGCTHCGTCTTDSPRPSVQNGNCESCNPNAVACMMRYNSDALCVYTPQQVGWVGGSTTTPVATTNTATNVTSTTATLNAMVNPNGSATTAYFQYGTSTSYGNSTSSQALGSGTAGVNVTASLNNLLPNTLYNVRVVATNAGGASYGANVTFTTPASSCQSTAISIGQALGGTLSAADCQSSKRGSGYYADRFVFNATAGQQVTVLLQSTMFDTFVYLSGPTGATIASDDDGGGGTNSRIPPGSGLIILSTSGAHTIEVTSFSPSSTGSYTLTLSGSSGGSRPGATIGNVTNVTANGATLNGSVNPNGLATERWFEYGTTTSYGSSTARQSLGSGSSSQAVSASISGLLPSTTYNARLAASNSAGTTYSTNITFTTSSTGTAPIARFTMSGGGQSGTEGQTLSYSVPRGGNVTTAFNDSRSSPGSGSITSVEWRSNGGFMSSQRSFSFTFGRGSHDISLRVVNSAGLSSTATARIVVNEYSAPNISSHSPATLLRSSTDRDVIVSGFDFQQNLTVRITFPSGQWATLSGAQIRNVSSNSFTMRVTLNAVGTWRIQVWNPDGGVSNIYSFSVR